MLVAVPVHLRVARVERLAQGLAARIRDQVVGDRDHELERLSQIADVDAPERVCRLEAEPLGREPPAALVGEGVEAVPDALHQRRRSLATQRLVNGAHEITTHVGHEGADRAQDPRARRGDDALDPDLAREEEAMRRSRAAEGQEREPVEVDGLARHERDEGRVHLRRRDAQHALRRLGHAQTEGPAEALEGRVGQCRIQLDPSSEEASWIDNTERDVRIPMRER